MNRTRSRPTIGMVIPNLVEPWELQQWWGVLDASQAYDLISVEQFELIAPLTLKLYFADRTEQIINFEPVLRGAWLRPLRDPKYFKQVKLNDTGNLEWPGGLK